MFATHAATTLQLGPFLPAAAKPPLGEREGFWESVSVAKTVTIPRASRGHSSNPKVNTDHHGFHLVLGESHLSSYHRVAEVARL